METKQFINRMNLALGKHELHLDETEEVGVYSITPELKLSIPDKEELDGFVIMADSVVKSMVPQMQLLHTAQLLYLIQTAIDALEFGSDNYSNTIIHALSHKANMHIELGGWHLRLKKHQGMMQATFSKKHLT